jgi:hypothetical protein
VNKLVHVANSNATTSSVEFGLVFISTMAISTSFCITIW